MKATAGSQHRGFTLLELMIVVILISLVAAIALPTFVRARTLSRKNSCIANLRQIENAKLVWANESKMGGSDAPSEGDLFGSARYLRETPRCPSGGRYTLTRVDTPTECNLAWLEGHTL